MRFSPTLATIVCLTALLSALSSPAQEADCLNYWLNPRTGQPECLGSGSSSPIPQQGTSAAPDVRNESAPPVSKPFAAGPASGWEQHIETLYEGIDLSQSPQQMLASIGPPTTITKGQMCQWGKDEFSFQNALFYDNKLSSWSGPDAVQELEPGMDSAQVRQRWGQPTRCKPALRYRWSWKQGNRECRIEAVVVDNDLSGKSKFCSGI